MQVEAQCLEPAGFTLVSSANETALLGEEATVTLFVSGTSPRRETSVSQELLGDALSLLRRGSNFKSSIVQSHAGLEAFLHDFLTKKLAGRERQPWRKKTFDRHVGRGSLAGSLRVFVDEVLGIRIVDTQAFRDWEGSTEKKGVRDLRNAIAHGKGGLYGKVLSNRGMTEKEAAEWALRTVMTLISDIR